MTSSVCVFLAAGYLPTVGKPATRKPRSIRSISQRRPPPTHPRAALSPVKYYGGKNGNPLQGNTPCAVLLVNSCFASLPPCLRRWCLPPRPYVHGGWRKAASPTGVARYAVPAAAGWLGRSLCLLPRCLLPECLLPLAGLVVLGLLAICPASASHRSAEKKFLFCFGWVFPCFKGCSRVGQRSRRLPLPTVARHARCRRRARWGSSFLQRGVP